MQADGFKPDTCLTHGDYTAMRFTFGGRELWSGCPSCDKAKREIRAAEVVREHLRETQEGRRGDALIPPRFIGKTVDNFQAQTDPQRLAQRVAQRYLAKWEESRRLGRCLVFAGWPGTGKTHLAAGIAQAIIDRGGTALFRSVPDAIAIVKASYDGAATEGQAYARLRAPDLLVLDDVGAVKLSEHDSGVLFRVLNARYEDQRPTILTTNLQADQLTAFLGDRIVDRLRDHGGMVVQFEWESFRK